MCRSSWRPISGTPIPAITEEILRWYGVAWSAIEKRITESFSTGEGFRETTRKIAQDIGPDAVEGRLSTLVRTEGMRAARGASRADMTAVAAEIPGEHMWQWIAARSARTCIACLAQDWKLFDFDAYPDRQHPACRCVISLYVSDDILPRTGPKPQTGDEWLRNQPETVQRKMLGTEARWKAWQDGASLDDFTGVRHDPVWGDSVMVLPGSGGWTGRVSRLDIQAPADSLPVLMSNAGSNDSPAPVPHPLYPGVSRSSDGVWDEDTVPVASWEVPSERRVAPPDIVEIMGARSPVVRVDAATVRKQTITKHRTENPQWHAFDETIGSWEHWKKQEPDSTRRDPVER